MRPGIAGQRERYTDLLRIAPRRCSPPARFRSFRPVSVVEKSFAPPHNHPMHDSTDSDLIESAWLYLDNERSFVVRRCVQRFEAGEITAREAVRRATSAVLAVDVSGAIDGSEAPSARSRPST